MEPTLAALKAAIRASPALQAYETGWREDGKNGYIWSASTPSVRCFEYHHSRGHEVVEALLGTDFQGCWARTSTLPTIAIRGCISEASSISCAMGMTSKEQYPEDVAVWQWFSEVKALYERALSYTDPDPCLHAAKQEAARSQQQHLFEQESWHLCAPFAHTTAPMHTLCERVERFLPELFVFVARPEVPSDNNLAERSVRPLVIARKMSGGSRSPKGSETHKALFSCFGSWAAQGLNPFLQCLALLSQPHSLG